MRCADCGLDLLAHATICPRCGSPVIASAPPPQTGGAPQVSDSSALPYPSPSGSSPVAWIPPTGPQALPYPPTGYQGAAGYQVPPPGHPSSQAASASSKRNLLLALVVAVLLVIAGGVVLIQRGSEGKSGAAAPVSSGPSSVSAPSTVPTTPAPTTPEPTSTTTPPASAPSIIDAGDLHACAVSVSGGLKCWGDNTDGRLGDGTTTVRLTPRGVAGLASGVRAVTAGGGHTCAVTTSGAVLCWGDNTNGQLGDGTTEDQSSPVDVVGLGSGVQAVSRGRCAHVCGDRQAERCCAGATTATASSGTEPPRISRSPVDVVGLGSGVRAVAAGRDHTCAVTASGAVKCWGANADRPARGRKRRESVVAGGRGWVGFGGAGHQCRR